MKRSSGVSTGYDDGPGWADEEEEEEGWVHVDDPAMLSSKEEAKMEAATAEVSEEEGLCFWNHVLTSLSMYTRTT